MSELQQTEQHAVSGAPPELSGQDAAFEAERAAFWGAAQEHIDQREGENLPPPTKPDEIRLETEGGRKLPPEESFTGEGGREEASHLITAARVQKQTTEDLDQRAELAKLIDEARSGVVTTESLGVETQPADHERLTKALQENPQLLAAVQQTIAQQQANTEYVAQQYVAAVVQNAMAATAFITSEFPELNNLHPYQLQTAIDVIGKRDPARAKAIVNRFNGIKSLVDEASRATQQYQQHQAAQYQAAWAQDVARHDGAFEQWFSSQDVSPEQRQEIKGEILDDLKRQGWSQAQIEEAWRTNPAMRSFSGQVQLTQAAMYRLNQKKMANVRRNKVVRTVPHVQRPGSPAERASDADVYLQKLSGPPGSSLSVKRAAELVTAQRNARRR